MALLTKWVILAFILLLGIWCFLWRGQLPYHVDAYCYSYPDHAVNLESFHRHALPLWNGLIACGTPQLASWQSASLYPPFWLFNWIGLPNGFMGIVLAHAALAFLGFYLWLRTLNLLPLGCALGAFAFAGSGHLVSCWNNLPFIATAAWIPWVFWAVRKALDRPDWRRWMVLGIVLSCQTLAGYVFFLFYTLLFLAIWFEAQKPSWASRATFGLTLLLSAGLTSIQWLPFLDFLSFGHTDPWPSYPYFMKPLEYATLLKPDLLGFLGSADYRGTFANGIFNLYFGLIPLALFLASFFTARRAHSLFWALSAVFFLAWMGGRSWFIWDFLPDRALEFLEPSKAVGLFLFCAITCAILNLDFLLASVQKRRELWAALASLLVVCDLCHVPFALLHRIPNLFQDAEMGQEARRMKNLVGDARILTIRTNRDVFFNGANAYEDSYLTPIRQFTVNSNAAWGFRSADGYQTLQVEGAANLKRYELKGWPFAGDLLDVAGVRFLLAPQGLPTTKYKLLEKGADHNLYQNPDASPNVRWVGGKREWDNRPRLLNQLALPHNPWKEKVDLEKDGGGGYVQLPPSQRVLACPPSQDGNSGIASRSSSSVRSSGPGYAVLNETYAPGWRTWIDGIPHPILRAYGLFMAVPIPLGGEHRVDFRYEPASFRLGAFLALLSFALAIPMVFSRPLGPGRGIG